MNLTPSYSPSKPSLGKVSSLLEKGKPKSVTFGKEDNGKEEEEEKDEEEEEEQDETFHFSENEGKFTDNSKVRMIGTRIIYETPNEKFNEYQNDPPDFEDLEKQRPLEVPRINNQTKRNDLYKTVVNRIQGKHERKISLASDPFYDFVMLVAGNTNTQSKRYGLSSQTRSSQTQSNNNNNNQHYRDNNGDQPITTDHSATPPRGSKTSKTDSERNNRIMDNENGKQMNHPLLYDENISSSSKKRSLETSSGPLRSNRERIEELDYQNKLHKTLAIPMSPNEQKRIMDRLKEGEREEEAINRQSEYQAWIDREEITGFSDLSELVLANARTAHLEITEKNIDLIDADLLDFINDNRMRILFAKLVGLYIAKTRFIHSNRVQLDGNYNRILSEIHAQFLEFSQWKFYPDNKNFVKFEKPKPRPPRGAPSFY